MREGAEPSIEAAAAASARHRCSGKLLGRGTELAVMACQWADLVASPLAFCDAHRATCE